MGAAEFSVILNKGIKNVKQILSKMVCLISLSLMSCRHCSNYLEVRFRETNRIILCSEYDVDTKKTVINSPEDVTRILSLLSFAPYLGYTDYESAPEYIQLYKDDLKLIEIQLYSYAWSIDLNDDREQQYFSYLFSPEWLIEHIQEENGIEFTDDLFEEKL